MVCPPRNSDQGEENERLARELREAQRQLREKERQNREDEREIARLKRINQLKQENRALEATMERTSLRRLLSNMPDLAENPKCTPSREDEEKAQERWNKYEKNPQTEQHPGCHKPAKREEESLEKYMNFQLNTRDENGHLIHSALMMTFDRTVKTALPLYNESCVESYLIEVLKDMLASYGIKNLDVVRQASLFSLRPDLIALADDGTTIFMFNARNPKSKIAIGQCHAHNLIQRQWGNDNPFTILSTYSETVIVRQNIDDEKYDSLLSKAQKLLQEGKLRNDIPSDRVKPLPSPAKDHLVQRISADVHLVDKIPGDDVMGSDLIVENPALPRTAKVSEIFGKENLFKAFALVCAAGIIAVEESKESRETNGSPLVPPPGYEFKATETDWRYILCREAFYLEKIRCIVDYNTAPQFFSCRYFHVYCTIGGGLKGRCILCSTTSGKMFVAMLYIVENPHHYQLADRAEAKKNSIKERELEAESEMNRWLNLSPEYNGYYNVMRLNQVPALTMPFFPPVPINEREGALPQIRDLLRRIALYRYDIDKKPPPNPTVDPDLSDNEYYLYGEVRWWHFGCRYNNEGIVITALELGSLVKIKCTEGEMHRLIDEQIAELERRKSDPIPPPERTFISNTTGEC